MNVLFIGGTGNISTSVSRACIARGIDLHMIVRGNRDALVRGATVHKGDAFDTALLGKIARMTRWDAVVDWIAYTPADIARDIDAFRGNTGQFIFISSASAYQKPPVHPVITESTPLSNPFWEYSRNKIACEEMLTGAYRSEGFPATIVRPSLTYDTVLPLAIGGWTEFTVVERIRKGEPIIVHGDGSSLWVLTHAEDFAGGFVGLLGHPQAVGEAFQITSDEVLTWDQIYTTTARAAGREPNIVHIPSDFIVACEESLRGPLLGDKSHSVIFDNSKIRRIVPGFRAAIPFHEGIRRTLEWFDADPARRIVRQETVAMFERILKAYGAHAPAR